jgi:hypothetical protein
LFSIEKPMILLSMGFENDEMNRCAIRLREMQ